MSPISRSRPAARLASRRPGRRGSAERGLCPLQGQGDARSGHGELRAQPARHDQRGRAARARRPTSTPTSGRRHPRPAAAAAADRRDARHRDASTRPRTSTASTRNAGRLAIGLARARSVHAARLPDAAQAASSATSPASTRSSIGRSNIVGKPMAQLLLGENCDGHDRPFAHARPARRRPPRRHRRRRGRPARDGPRRLDQARRDRDRRRHQPRCRPTTARAGWSATSPSTKRREVAGGDHAGARRRRADDHRLLMRNTLVAAHRRAGFADPEGL